MKDHFLRADSREIIDQALQAAGLLTYIDGEPSYAAAVDYVGAIYRPTGSLIADEDGGEYPEMKPIVGYHVNLRGDLTEAQIALLPIIDPPNHPQRIFAGGILT